MGLRLILILLKLLFALIRLRKRLKPFKRLYVFLPQVYKFRVGIKVGFSRPINMSAKEKEKGRRKREKKRERRKEKKRRKKRREKREKFKGKERRINRRIKKKGKGEKGE